MNMGGGGHGGAVASSDGEWNMVLTAAITFSFLLFS